MSRGRKAIIETNGKGWDQMSAIYGHEIGKALCDALGLPKMAKSFVLRAEAGRIVSVECEYFVEDGARLVEALAEFELTRKTAAPAAQDAAACFDTWMRKRTDAAHAAFMAQRHAH